MMGVVGDAYGGIEPRFHELHGVALQLLEEHSPGDSMIDNLGPRQGVTVGHRAIPCRYPDAGWGRAALPVWSVGGRERRAKYRRIRTLL